MEPEAVSRSQAYWGLALAFRPPPPLSPRQPGDGGDARELLLDYTRLFLGPGRPIAHPYESAQREGQLMGAAALQVAECYAEAGLQVSRGQPHVSPLPDHVSVELAFMAHLAAQEERDPDQAEQWRERQRRFLREHLARWLPGFCEQVEAGAPHSFYCDAAREAKRLVEEDAKRLAIGDWRLEIGDCEAQSATLRLRSPSPGWTGGQVRNPQSKVKRRFPNIHLAIDPTLCTLCTLCADNCRPDALAVQCTPTTISLAFDPARCNGCRACLRLCPEGAITIERGAPLSAPPSRPVGATLVVASAPRVTCPVCQCPHVAAPWLERLAERLGGGEPTRRSLARCPFCKAAAGEGTPIPIGWLQESFACV